MCSAARPVSTAVDVAPLHNGIARRGQMETLIIIILLRFFSPNCHRVYLCAFLARIGRQNLDVVVNHRLQNAHATDPFFPHSPTFLTVIIVIIIFLFTRSGVAGPAGRQVMDKTRTTFTIYTHTNTSTGRYHA